MGEPVLRNEKWFIKVSDAARGPFTLHDLFKKLIDAEITIHDEISKDAVSWVAICNEVAVEEFLKASLETKKHGVPASVDGPATAAGSGEREEVTLSNIDKIAAGITGQLQEAEHLSRLSFEASAIRKFLTEIQVHRTRKVVVEVQESRPKWKQAEEVEYIIKKGPRQPIPWALLFRRALKLVLLIAFVGGAYWTYTFQKQQALLEQERMAREAIKKGLELKALGEYQKSLEIFRGISDISVLDPEQLLEIAEVARREGSAQEGAHFATLARKSAVSDQQRAKASLILGMIEAEKSNGEMATIHFDDSLKSKPDFAPALYNLGLLHLASSRLEEAERVFLKALQYSGPVAPILLALSEVSIQLDYQNQKVERVLVLEPLFLEYANRFDDYRYEIALAQLRIAVVKRDARLIDARLKYFLERNADTHQRQERDALYSHSRLDGRALYSWCMDIFSKLPRSPQLNAMIGLCLFRNGDINEALKFAQAAAEADPKNIQLTGLYGMLLAVTGQNEKSNLVFETSRKYGTSKYELSTRAATCEKMGNWSCAIENWEKLRRLDKGEAAATEGLVRAYYQLQDFEKVRPLLREGLARYPGLQSLKKISLDMLSKGHAP